MEQENYQLDISEELVLFNRLNNQVNDIFDLELRLPDYYDEKILRGGVQWARYAKYLITI